MIDLDKEHLKVIHDLILDVDYKTRSEDLNKILHLVDKEIFGHE